MPQTVPAGQAIPVAAAAASATVPPAVVSRPSSSRGVWLALGAVLGVGVLIAAGIYIPRRLKTHADPNKAMFPAAQNASDSTNANAPAPPTPTAPEATTPSTPSNPIVSLQSDQGSLKVDANGNVTMESPQGSMHVDASTGSVKMTGKGKNLSARNPTPSRQEGEQAQAPAPPPGPAPEEIAKVEDEADKLNVRAATATQSVETLRQQQQASGYNLRADIASSEERMKLYMDKGNNALQAHDLKNAQKYFDLAEVELAKVEKFLGH